MSKISIRFRPGNQINNFEIYRKSSKTNDKGRILYDNDSIYLDCFHGSITQSNQKEIDRWKQLNHAITHTITIRGCVDLKATDMVKLDDRNFAIHGVDNPGNLGIYYVAYAEERFDL